MIIYWCTFTLSYLLARVSEIAKDRRIFRLLVYISTLPPILLATFRSTSVGRDVFGYQVPAFELAILSDSFQSYLDTIHSTFTVQDLEWGYATFVYVCARFSSDIASLFGAQACLIIIPVAEALLQFQRFINRQHLPVSISIGLFTFLVLHYNLSLSLVRQSIACSFCLLACGFIVNRKFFPSFICTAIATIFHSSGITSTVFVALWLLLTSKLRKGALFATTVALILLTVASNVLTTVVLVRLTNMGLFTAKFVDWQNNSYYNGLSENGVNFVWLAMSLIFCGMAAFSYKCRATTLNLYLLIISLCFLAFFPFASEYNSFARVQLYFLYFEPVIIPLFLSILHQFLYRQPGIPTHSAAEQLESGARLFILATLIASWFASFVLFDYSDTVPYTSGQSQSFNIER